MAPGITSGLFSNGAIRQLFSDNQSIQYLLDVEQALAQAEGALGIIPAGAAEAIVQGIETFTPQLEDIRLSAEKTGVPVIALVKQLRTHIGGSAASYVHWGATSQDIMDTALILQLREALDLLGEMLFQVIENLAALSDTHRYTLMVGRTHSQQAVPVTFGLKVAAWLTPLIRHHQRLSGIRQRLLVIQLGGAAGTLSPLGEKGTAVEQELATLLELSTPLMPWHTQRDNLAELAGWLSMVSGSLGKMAQDIILMAQTEIGELRESSDPERGGSSTMPQKSNPVISEVILAAARQNASLLASMHHALIQEHERATHGWQLEWLTLPQMLELTAFSLERAVFLSSSLEVHTERMLENVHSSNGLILAEAVSFALSDALGRAEAQRIVKECSIVSAATGRNLVDVVKERIEPSVPVDWSQIDRDDISTGSSQVFIDRVLKEVDHLRGPSLSGGVGD